MSGAASCARRSTALEYTIGGRRGGVDKGEGSRRGRTPAAAGNDALSVKQGLLTRQEATRTTTRQQSAQHAVRYGQL